jgi:hypothetical protein
MGQKTDIHPMVLRRGTLVQLIVSMRSIGEANEKKGAVARPLRPAAMRPA